MITRSFAFAALFPCFLFAFAFAAQSHEDSDKNGGQQQFLATQHPPHAKQFLSEGSSSSFLNEADEGRVRTAVSLSAEGSVASRESLATTIQEAAAAQEEAVRRTEARRR